MLVLFKTHTRNLIEWCNGAIYHAAPSKLAQLGYVQTSFLRHLELDERHAFRDSSAATDARHAGRVMENIPWQRSPRLENSVFMAHNSIVLQHNAKTARHEHSSQMVTNAMGHN